MMDARTWYRSAPRYVAAAALAFATARAAAAQVTTTSDRTAFAAALGVPLTVENFTSSFAFPLGPTLNSASSYPAGAGHAINPGDIKPGVTYSVASGALVINEGSALYFTGGFLSACRPNSGCVQSIAGTLDPLVATFDSAVRGFGFDAAGVYGAFDITVNFVGGSYSSSFTPFGDATGGSQFFGFYRPTADILSVSIITTNRARQSTFAIDNFTFPTVGVTAAPEPATIVLVAGGLLGVAAVARRRRNA